MLPRPGCSCSGPFKHPVSRKFPTTFTMKKTTVLLTAASAIVLTGLLVWKTQDVPVSAPSPPAASSNADKHSVIKDRGTALSERLKAAREISTDLTNQELKELIAFLSKPLEKEGSEAELMAMNEVMDQLRVSGMACGEYATALCGLIREPGTHPVVRDYAMQHAVQWMREAKRGQAPAKLDEADRKRLLDCMVSYLQSPVSPLETGFGTALNLIRAFIPEYPKEAAEIFALCSPRILDISSGRESAPLGNRISAIQSMPALPDRAAALSLVREMVGDTKTDSPVRLVTIATLGALGDDADLTILRQIQEDDRNLAYAARSAAARLESTLASSGQ